MSTIKKKLLNIESLNLTAAFKVDFCGKTSGVVGVVQRAEDGRLGSRHSEQHHQDGTQNVALHHFHRLVELLQEQKPQIVPFV